MNAAGSVTLWVQQFKAGDQVALQKLWEAYFGRLVRLARKKLQGAPHQVDDEGAALSAFHSFYRGVEQGRFPQLLDRRDLWQVLGMLTVRKALNQARKARALKRGGGRGQSAEALDGPEEERRAFEEMISREPDPRDAAEMAEECKRLLELLPDKLREVALLKTEGHSNQEIATKIGRAIVTVERRLGDIRAIWEKEVGA